MRPAAAHDLKCSSSRAASCTHSLGLRVPAQAGQVDSLSFESAPAAPESPRQGGPFQEVVKLFAVARRQCLLGAVQCLADLRDLGQHGIPIGEEYISPDLRRTRRNAGEIPKTATG